MSTTSIVLESIQDTYISGDNPTINSFGAETLKVGVSDTTVFSVPVGYIPKRSFIASAYLDLFVESSTGTLNGTASILSPADALIEEMTWESKRDNSLWSSSGGEFLSTPSVLFSAGLYREIVLSDGPIGYWRLGESSGTTATDETSNHYDGTYVNSPTLGAVGIGMEGDTAVSLARASSQRITASPSLPTNGAAFTFEVWVKPNTHTANDGLIAYGSGSTGASNALRLNITGSTYGITHYWFGGGNYDLTVSIPAALNDGVFHHIVVTWDGFKRTMYLDGQEIAVNYPTGNTLVYASSNFQIGKTIQSGEYLDGVIDEVAVYNYALSANKVLTHYQMGQSKWSLDITDLLRYVADNGLPELRFGLQADSSTSSSSVVLSSASSTTQSQRPILRVEYFPPTVISNDNYARVLGSWATASDGDLPFISTPTHMALSPSVLSDEEDPRSITAISSEEVFPIVAKGAAKDHVSFTAIMDTKDSTTTDYFATETGIYKKTGGSVIKSLAMDEPRFTASTYVEEVLVDAPKSYWRLGETAGLKAVDKMGIIDGTYSATGITYAQTAPTGISDSTAVKFTAASTGKVTIADGTSMEFADRKPFSVEVWMQSNNTGTRQLVYKKDGSGNGWELSLASTSAVFNRKQGAENNTATSVTSVQSTSYKHVVCVYDGAYMKLYINGALDVTTQSTAKIVSHGTNMILASTGSGSYYDDKLDDVAIYDYALTDDRIAMHYWAGIAALPTPNEQVVTKYTGYFSSTVTPNKGFAMYLNPEVNAGSLSILDSYISFHQRTASNSYTFLRLEIGNDNRNFYYWNINVNTLTLNNTWQPVVSYFADANIYGNPFLGDFTHLKLSGVTPGSAVAFITDNYMLVTPYTDTSLFSQGYGTIKRKMYVSGNEITDETRTGAWSGDGKKNAKTFGIYRSSTNLCTNGSFDIDTTGWSKTDADSSMTATRVTDTKKFGAACYLLSNADAGDDDYVSFSLGSPVANRKYTISAWAKVDSFGGAASNSRGLMAYDTAVSASTRGTSNQWTTIVSSTRDWVKHVISITTSGSPGSLQVRLYGPQGSTYWDGVQIETDTDTDRAGIDTPFIATTSAALTRGASRVRFYPHFLLSGTQGWVAAKIRMNWDISQSPGTSTLFEWIDPVTSTNFIKLYLDGSTDAWNLDRENTGAQTNLRNPASTSTVFKKGDDVVVIAYWTATQLGLSINGGTFLTQANTALPDFVSATGRPDIGSSAGTSNFLDSEIVWFAAGTGTLTNTDAATIAAFTNVDFSLFPAASENTMVWSAENEDFLVKFFREGQKGYRIDTKVYLSPAVSVY